MASKDYIVVEPHDHFRWRDVVSDIPVREVSGVPQVFNGRQWCAAVRLVCESCGTKFLRIACKERARVAAGLTKGVYCKPCGRGCQNTERAQTRKAKLPLPETVVGAKWIPLSRGKFALVDDRDYVELSKVMWSYATVGYAYRSIGREIVYMHKIILPPKDNLEIDHKNGNKLDNRRSNLRHATSGQNKQNRPREKTSQSKYKGVWFHKKLGKWVAAITVKRKATHLGVFDAPEEAARAYDKAAKKLFGEFARLNFKKRDPWLGE